MSRRKGKKKHENKASLNQTTNINSKASSKAKSKSSSKATFVANTKENSKAGPKTPGSKVIYEEADIDDDRKHKKHKKNKYNKTNLTTWEGLLLLLVLKEKGLLDDIFEEDNFDSYDEEFTVANNKKASKKSEDHYVEVDSLQEFMDSQQDDYQETGHKRKKEYYDFEYIQED